MPRQYFTSVARLRGILPPRPPEQEGPRAPGRVLFKRPSYLVHWKFKTKKPPRPKRWVTLTVFLADPNLRRRSYRVLWNGQRFARGDLFELLRERHPDIAAELPRRLEGFNDRLIKPHYSEEEFE